ncbi:hypothetical protein [Rhodoferax sp. GW822-FHT02A01]|uniref:hypothetical protein n=1 Tax=Rhodoferax sp. GW822-FHT02A01 TaxID=3141537 RepID=UPI00315D8281
MKQKELPLLGRLDAPSVVDPQLVRQCKTYRDAVKLCWRLRRVKYMTQAQLAAEAGLYAPHVSGYLHDGKHQRDLPGDKAMGFQYTCGNTAIAQWHNMNVQLTCAEEMQLVMRAVA